MIFDTLSGFGASGQPCKYFTVSCGKIVRSVTLDLCRTPYRDSWRPRSIIIFTMGPDARALPVIPADICFSVRLWSLSKVGVLCACVVIVNDIEGLVCDVNLRVNVELFKDWYQFVSSNNQSTQPICWRICDPYQNEIIINLVIIGMIAFFSLSLLLQNNMNFSNYGEWKLSRGLAIYYKFYDIVTSQAPPKL